MTLHVIVEENAETPRRPWVWVREGRNNKKDRGLKRRRVNFEQGGLHIINAMAQIGGDARTELENIAEAAFNLGRDYQRNKEKTKQNRVTKK